MFIDTHTHLDFENYTDDREKVIQRALEKKVVALVTIGTNLETSRLALELAEKYTPVYAAVGIHPNDSASAGDEDLVQIEKLAAHPKVVAIGEVGLDYYRDHASPLRQQEVFTEQIAIAHKLKKPLIIHNREAHQDMLGIIREYNAGQVGGVFHSFSGDKSYLEKILLENFHISFTGNLTYKNSTSAELISNVPLDRLLLETDSPFLAPVPMRGKRNEPAFLLFTAAKIAELYPVELETLERVTTENAARLFKIEI